jgi:hypothetical protein
MSDCICPEPGTCPLYRAASLAQWQICRHQSGLPRAQEDYILSRLARKPTEAPKPVTLNNGRLCRWFGPALKNSQGQTVTLDCPSCAGNKLERLVVHACLCPDKAEPTTTVAYCQGCTLWSKKD